MDTSDWKTYPVGRYLIDLPPSAQFYWHPLRFGRKFDLVWKKGMTIEEANALLREEAEAAKQSPHDIKGDQLIVFWDEFGTAGLGTGLRKYSYPFSTDSILYKQYFVNGLCKYTSDLKRSVYAYEEEAIADSDGLTLDTMLFVEWISNSIAPADSNLPMEIVPGTYFEGGVLYGPDKNIPWPKWEEIGIEVTFPEYPGIEFSIFFQHMQLDTGTKPNTTLAGNPAEETLQTFIENDILHYAFSLNAPSKKDRMDVPLILMHLRNPLAGVVRNGISTSKPPIKQPSFESKEEAIIFWTRVRESVRWRPDNWIVDAPDQPYYIVNGKIVPANFDATANK